MATESGQLQWQGKVETKLQKATPEQVWPLLEDFFNIHNLLPSIDTCHKVEDLEGFIRYCSATLPPSDGDEMVLKWCYEKLVEIDPIKKCLSYEVLENNMGFMYYKSTVEVMSIDGGDDLHGCQIEWSFLTDPIEGLSYEDLVNYLDFSIQGMAQNMEKALDSGLTAEIQSELYPDDKIVAQNRVDGNNDPKLHEES